MNQNFFKSIRKKNIYFEEFEKLSEESVVDDLVEPGRVLPYDLPKECESCSFRRLIRLLQTLLEFVEDVIVVWRLNFDEDLKDSKRVGVRVVVNHAIHDPILFCCKEEGISYFAGLIMMTIKKWLKEHRAEKNVGTSLKPFIIH